MKYLLMLAVPMLLMTSALPQAPAHYVVSSHSIVHALAGYGVVVAEWQVALPAAVVTDTQESMFDVNVAAPPVDRQDGSFTETRLRLSCRSPQHCIPFYVALTLPASVKLPAAWTAIAPKIADTSAVSMKVGSQATLWINTMQMQIRIPVISLQNGALGATIRVASLDRKQVYVATVAGPTTLTGAM